MCNTLVESNWVGTLIGAVPRLAVLLALCGLVACGEGPANTPTAEVPGATAGDDIHDPSKPYPAVDRCDPAASRCGSRFCTDGVCCDVAACPTGERCDIPSRGGTCHAPQENGVFCSLDTHCQSGFCVESTCCAAAACADGESCNLTDHAGECSALPTPPPPTATRTRRPTVTPTATPPAAALRVSSVAGEPGERVSIVVSLDNGGAVVVATQNDLVLDGINVSIAAGESGLPDCAVEPAINKGASAFAFLPPSCEGVACTGIRALVLAVDNLEPIADGSVLYRCNVDIASAAPDGAYPVTVAHIVMSDPRGNAVRLTTGADGQISVGDH